jgi:hypothetical protein
VGAETRQEGDRETKYNIEKHRETERDRIRRRETDRAYEGEKNRDI